MEKIMEKALEKERIKARFLLSILGRFEFKLIQKPSAECSVHEYFVTIESTHEIHGRLKDKV